MFGTFTLTARIKSHRGNAIYRRDIYPILIKVSSARLSRALGFLSRHSKLARELASRHVASNERGHEPRNTSLASRFPFVNQKSLVYILTAEYRYRILEGAQTPMSFFPFLCFPLEKRTLMVGIHPRIKRAAFPFSLQPVDLLPRLPRTN